MSTHALRRCIWIAGLAGIAAWVSLAAPPPALAATDFLALRERLEVERAALRQAMQPYQRANEAAAYPAEKPGVAFGKYLDAVWKAVDARNSFPEVHAALASYRGKLDPTNDVQRQALGVLLGDYFIVRYGDDYWRELKALVAFRTFNNILDRNSDNAEIRRCFDWLGLLAGNLGLESRNHAYTAFQVALPASGSAAGAAPLVVYTHADVPRVIEHKWTSNPFDLVVRQDRWVGVGVYDAKGPLLLNVFLLRVLRDAGLQLQRPLVVFVDANGEEAENDARKGLAALQPPAAGVLAACGEFPYASGEMGRLVARIASTRGMKSRTGIKPGEFYIYKLRCAPGFSTVPSESRTWVRYEPPRDVDNVSLFMVNKWRAIIEAYQPDHAACVYENYVQEDTLHYFVYGQPAHVMHAGVGTNSILETAGSLMRVPLYRNSASDVMLWIDKGIDRDLTGGKLGLAFEHPEMGSTVVTPVGFDRLGDEVAVLVDIRWPVGHDAAWVKKQLAASLAAFNKKHATNLTLGWEPVVWEPVQAIPPAEIRTALDGAYALASGEGAEPVRATANTMRLLPAAIPFGPEWPRGGARGHTRDESISMRELQDLGVAYAAALAWLGAGPLPRTP